MVQGQIARPHKEAVAVYLDESPDSGWFGHSGWFKRVVLRREFSIYETPRLITREDARMLKIANTLFGQGRLKIYELMPLQT